MRCNPYTGKPWAPNAPDQRQVSSQPFCSSQVRPGPCWGSLGAEMPLSLRCKCVPVWQSRQFVLVSLATKSSAGIKGLCPRLDTEGQGSLTAHNSDQPQLVLISHSWGFFKKRIKSVQTQNNVRVCFNTAGRLFQLFGAGSLKNWSLPPIVSGAPDTWMWIAWFKQRADWQLVLDNRTENSTVNKEWTIINLKNTLQETCGCCSVASCWLFCSA